MFLNHYSRSITSTYSFKPNIIYSINTNNPYNYGHNILSFISYKILGLSTTKTTFKFSKSFI